MRVLIKLPRVPSLVLSNIYALTSSLPSHQITSLLGAVARRSTVSVTSQLSGFIVVEATFSQRVCDVLVLYVSWSTTRPSTFYGGLVGQARISFRSFRRHSLNVAIPSELCLLYVILGVIHVQSCSENIVSDYVTPCFALNSSLKRFSEYIVMQVI